MHQMSPNVTAGRYLASLRVGSSPTAVAKAMDTFDFELAADRGAWRTMLRSGEAPLGFRQAPPPPVPMPMSHFHAHQRRDRRVEARRERQLLTTSRCAACPSL